MRAQLFVDMDGVLADFDTHHEIVLGWRPDKKADNVNWNAVREVKDFYLQIPPMGDLQVLWEYISRFNPIVLTGVPSSVPEAAQNKCDWVRNHLGSQIEVRCCLSKEKCLHASPGDVLIDDWEKYRPLWEGKGGRWITHISADITIERLRKMGL